MVRGSSAHLTTHGVALSFAAALNFSSDITNVLVVYMLAVQARAECASVGSLSLLLEVL